MKWYIILALICISLINDAEHLFKCLLVIWQNIYSSPLLTFGCCFCCLFVFWPRHTACRIFPDQGLKPWPLQWEHRVLINGLPGKSFYSVLNWVVPFFYLLLLVKCRSSLYILGINYQVYYLQIFSPFCGLSFLLSW